MTSTNSFDGPPRRESPLRQCRCGSVFLAYEAFAGWAAREARRYDLDFGPSDAPRAAFVRREQLPVLLERPAVRSNPTLEMEIRHALWSRSRYRDVGLTPTERENVERLIALMRAQPRPEWPEVRAAYTALGGEAWETASMEDWAVQLAREEAEAKTKADKVFRERRDDLDRRHGQLDARIADIANLFPDLRDAIFSLQKPPHSVRTPEHQNLAWRDEEAGIEQKQRELRVWELLQAGVLESDDVSPLFGILARDRTAATSNGPGHRWALLTDGPSASSSDLNAPGPLIERSTIGRLLASYVEEVAHKAFEGHYRDRDLGPPEPRLEKVLLGDDPAYAPVGNWNCAGGGLPRHLKNLGNMPADETRPVLAYLASLGSTVTDILGRLHETASPEVTMWLIEKAAIRCRDDLMPPQAFGLARSP